MIPETENTQEAKRVCPGYSAWHAEADPGLYLSQSTILDFWCVYVISKKNKYTDKYKSLSYQ